MLLKHITWSRWAKAAVLAILASVVAIPLALSRPADDAPKPQKGRNLLMQMKLGHAQKVLEGLAVQDFDLMAKNAEELAIISKKAEWQVLKTPDYLRYGDEFRRQADSIIKASKDKNIDAAALAYVQLTMTCVNCHKHVRETRIALGDDKPWRADAE